MRRPAAQNPFCWHWRPPVQGTLMSHLIPGVDSPVPGPGRASELAWRLSLNAGRLDIRPELLGSLGPSHSDRLSVRLGWGWGGLGEGRGAFSTPLLMQVY